MDSKVTKILFMHLKNTFKKSPAIHYEVHDVALEDDLSYTLALKPDVHSSSTQVIAKADVNEVKYVQMYSHVDGRTYWHFDVYVFAEMDQGSQLNGFIEFWTGEIKQRAMTELREQNRNLKDLYKGIESL